MLEPPMSLSHPSRVFLSRASVPYLSGALAVGVLAASVLAAAYAPAARADRLVLADGRTIEGVVTKDGETYHVVSRFGESELAAKEVKSWEKGKTLEEEWRARSAALTPDDHAGRAALAKWLSDAGRVEEARGVASQVVEADPENALAHEVLGHVRHAGAWMTPDDAKRADGLVERGGQWYSPEEWVRLDAEAKAKVNAKEGEVTSKRVAARVNEAVRLMLAPDAKLRDEGARRLEAIAKETKTEAIGALVPKLRAFADATDQLLAAAAGGGGSSSTVLAECRIQLARLKRPIQNFTTSLAGNINSAPVTIQLPEVEIIRLDTTVGIPAGVH